MIDDHKTISKLWQSKPDLKLQAHSQDFQKEGYIDVRSVCLYA